MARHLPFLNGVRAFEAAARQGSFSGAGVELHVSPAAVSRMVGLLEHRLGVALFERRANRLAVTAAGEAYRSGLGRILDDLEALTERVRQDAGRQVVTIDAGPSFSTHWLIPRLADFQARHPGIEVRLAFRGADTPFDDSCSGRIRLGEGRWPGLTATPLLPADLRPVCTTEMATRMSGRLPDPALMLRVAHAPSDWPDWLAAHGVQGLAPRGPVFDFHGQAQQAAADGLGVAMGLRPYIDGALSAGTLVAPFATVLPKQAGWFLIHRASRAQEPGFSGFREWLLEAVSGTVRGIK